MGLAETVKRMKAKESEKAAQRLFKYVREERTLREVLPMKVGDLFRASSLPYLCPREEVLASKYDVIRAEHVHPSLEITWRIGHLFHDLYRDYYYGPMQEWAGAWECVRCGWDTDSSGLSDPPTKSGDKIFPGKLARMPRECGGCGAPFILPEGVDGRTYGTFREWQLEDHGIGVKGHPDGWSLRQVVERTLVDLKSHGANGFGSRRTLRDGHDLQVWAYQYMTGDENGEVWYLNKSPWGDPGSFVRDVVTPFDVSLFRERVVSPLEQVRNGVAGGPVPERMCINSECVRASECQLVDVCFDV